MGQIQYCVSRVSLVLLLGHNIVDSKLKIQVRQQHPQKRLLCLVIDWAAKATYGWLPE